MAKSNFFDRVASLSVVHVLMAASGGMLRLPLAQPFSGGFAADVRLDHVKSSDQLEHLPGRLGRRSDMHVVYVLNPLDTTEQENIGDLSRRPVGTEEPARGLPFF